MNMRKGTAVLPVILALTVSVSVLGAGQNPTQNPRNQDRQRQQQQQQQQKGQAPPAIGPQAQSPDELNAFIALQNEQSPATKVTLADAFVAKFPTSDFVSYAHTFRVVGYSQQGKPREAAGAAEQALDTTIKFGEKMIARAEADSKLTDKEKENLKKKDKNAVFLDKSSPEFQTFMAQFDQRILGFYQSLIGSYQQLNDAAKMLEWGEKALGYKPDDLNTLMMVSNVMAERPPADEKLKTAHLKRAEELANEAITQLPTFLSSPAAAQATAEQKAEITAGLHYTLGLIYLNQKKYSDSEKELLTSLQSKNNDPVTYYRLGIAYAQDMKNDPAMDALAKSAFLKGVSEANARDILKQLYVQKNKSEQGLEDFIKGAGQKIGK